MRLLVALVAGVLLQGAASALARPANEWIAASVAPEGSPSQRVCDAALEAVRASSGVALTFKRRYSAVLGDEITTIRALQDDKVQMVCASAGAVADLAPELRFLELPYLFRTFEAYQAFLGTFRRKLGADYQRIFRGRGIVGGPLTFIGWRNFAATKRAIRQPADLRGMRVRSQPAELHLAWWSALGAVPKATALPEVDGALASGIVEALDVPIAYLYATSALDRIRHFTLSRHMAQTGLVAFSRRAWDGLPKARHRAIEDALEKVQIPYALEHLRFDDELVAALRERGVAVLSLDEGAREAFARQGRAFQESVRRSVTGDGLRFFQALLRAAGTAEEPAR